MPWFQTKDGKRAVFTEEPEPITASDSAFCAGDYACPEVNDNLRHLTEEEFLEMTRDMEQLDG